MVKEGRGGVEKKKVTGGGKKRLKGGGREEEKITHFNRRKVRRIAR